MATTSNLPFLADAIPPVSVRLPYLPDSIPVSVQFIVIGIILVIGIWAYGTIDKSQPLPGFTLVSLPEIGLSPKESWRTEARKTIAKGIATCSGKPFQIMTGTGPKIVLPIKYSEEVKSDTRLNFAEAKGMDFFINYPGFEPFRDLHAGDKFLSDLIRDKLTRGLGLVIPRVVDEATSAMHDVYGESTEWHPVPIQKSTLHFVARLSSRIFVGEKLCRDEGWLEIVRGYTINVFAAARQMRHQHPLVRPITHHFNKHNRIIRKHIHDANIYIENEIAERIAKEAKARKAGLAPTKASDTVGWMMEMSGNEEVDYVNAQLGLTMAAIHTTTEALKCCLSHICTYPEVIQPLRDEIIEVLSEEPWSKASMYKLKVMDSFLKESQRMAPPSVFSMNRLVKAPIALSDGTVLPTGARCITAGNYMDPTVFPEPEKFDIYRFLNLRTSDEKNKNSYQHVTTTSNFIAFGHGAHACPGRFFASNELKIALSHLLLKYDIAMDKERPPNFSSIYGATTTDPTARMMMRRRKEEINVDLYREID